ncbi:MAG: HEPN domain-containing protein [Chloroflexi bacterium]|nr:HEPN domain-containing protein [Chloroflexota bacterium]
MNPTIESRPAGRSALSREIIQARLRSGVLAVREDVVGIIIFGSVAREGAGRDVDVLVVLSEPLLSRAAWRVAVIQLAQAIDLPAVDVLPLPLAALRANLSAHRPLYMDVAFDGVVILDRGHLADLLAEARREITAAGIRRTETGWRYPVRYRRVSLLSPESNSTRAGRWLVDAERDLQVAEQLRTAGFFDRSAYHSQQSIERSVKAVLICFGRFERTHWVGKKLQEALAGQEVQQWREELTRLAELSLHHEPDAIAARYIDDEDEELGLPWKRYREPEAVAAITSARAALEIAGDFVAWWFVESEALDRVEGE